MLEDYNNDLYCCGDDDEGEAYDVLSNADSRLKALIFPYTGEDLAEGASFWHAFLTPFWGPETIIIFKRNYVEAMFRLSQIQDKPSKSFDQNQPDTTFGQKLVQSTNVPEVKGYMTKPKRTKISEEHNKILGGIESYGFTYREA